MEKYNDDCDGKCLSCPESDLCNDERKKLCNPGFIPFEILKMGEEGTIIYNPETYSPEDTEIGGTTDMQTDTQPW